MASIETILEVAGTKDLNLYLLSDDKSDAKTVRAGAVIAGLPTILCVLQQKPLKVMILQEPPIRVAMNYYTGTVIELCPQCTTKVLVARTLLHWSVRTNFGVRTPWPDCGAKAYMNRPTLATTQM